MENFPGFLWAVLFHWIWLAIARVAGCTACAFHYRFRAAEEKKGGPFVVALASIIASLYHAIADQLEVLNQTVAPR
jgi:hypothetical protein